MGNVLGRANITLVLVNVVLIGLLIGGLTAEVIDNTTFFGSIAALLVIDIVLFILSRGGGRAIPIGLTSVDALRFAIDELAEIKRTQPNVINQIARVGGTRRLIG